MPKNLADEAIVVIGATVVIVDHATVHVTRGPLVDRDLTVPPATAQPVVRVRSGLSADRVLSVLSADLAPNVRVDPLYKRRSDSTRAVSIATLCWPRSPRSSSPLRNNCSAAASRPYARPSSIKTRS